MHINGPLNIIRLEGNINCTTKVLYLFGDIHINYKLQTKCDTANSIDIDKYFKQLFKKISTKSIKSNKIYDFFIEITPSLINDKIRKKEKIYIEKSISWVADTFVIKNNQVQLSKTYPKIRFHYVDIRDYLINNLNDMLKISNLINDMVVNLNIDSNNLDNIVRLIKYDIHTIKLIYNMFYKYKHKQNTIQTNLLDSSDDHPSIHILRIEKLIGKIKSKYSNKNVENIINQIIDGELLQYFELYFKLADKFIVLINKIKNQINIKSDELFNCANCDDFISYGLPYDLNLSLINKLNQMRGKYEKIELKLLTLITDIFFVRRFVDKSYITNGIVYTGISHSANYIYILVKYFGFKITHASYLKHSLKKQNNIIKNTNMPNIILKYIMPTKLKQCSSIKLFPTNFE